MKVLPLVMLLTVAFTTRKCLEYVCKNKANNTGTCTVFTPTGMEITPCQEGYICQIPKDGDGTCIKAEEVNNRLAGEYCEEDAQCYSGNCDKNVCGGRKDKKCTGLSDCDVEQNCLSGICKDAAADCSLEEGKFCKSNEVCVKNKCVTIGSLPTPSDSDSPIACESYFIKDNVCAHGPKLVEKEGKCHYKLDDKNGYDEAKVCIKDEKGSSFCAKGEGDITISAVNFYLPLVYKFYEVFIQT